MMFVFYCFLGWHWLQNHTSVQLDKTLSSHCIICPSPLIKSLSICIYPPLSSSTNISSPIACSYHHTFVSVYVLGLYICFFLNPFTFLFHPDLPHPSTLKAVNLFYKSIVLFLFCLLNYFVHYIAYVSEIIWYFSFSNWLIHLAQYSPGPSMLLQR